MGTSNIYSRNLELKHNTEAKLAQQRTNREQNELQGCSFRPVITRYNSSMFANQSMQEATPDSLLFGRFF